MKKTRINPKQMTTSNLEKALLNASGVQKSKILKELEVRKVIIKFK